MQKDSLLILQLISTYLKKHPTTSFSIPTLDRIVMDAEPRIIFEGKLGGILDDLYKQGFVEYNKGFVLTKKTIHVLEDL
jgi:hypothetical protein